MCRQNDRNAEYAKIMYITLDKRENYCITDRKQ